MNMKPIIEFIPLDHEQKQAVLTQEFSGSSIYNIKLDNIDHGQVQ